MFEDHGMLDEARHKGKAWFLQQRSQFLSLETTIRWYFQTHLDELQEDADVTKSNRSSGSSSLDVVQWRCEEEDEAVRTIECALAQFARPVAAMSRRRHMTCALYMLFDRLWWRIHARVDAFMAQRASCCPQVRAAFFRRFPLTHIDDVTMADTLPQLTDLVLSTPAIPWPGLARELALRLIERMHCISVLHTDVRAGLMRLGVHRDWCDGMRRFVMLEAMVRYWFERLGAQRHDFLRTLLLIYRDARWAAHNERMLMARLVLRRLAARHGLPPYLLGELVPMPPLECDPQLMADIYKTTHVF
jgi:hypothetical protein